MAFDTAYPQILANLAAGNQPVATVDSNFTPLYNGLNSLNTFGNYYVDSGAADAYIVTITARQSATLSAGLSVQFKAANVNTGASTLNVNGTGAKNILNPDGTALSAGQIPANALVSVMYDGTQYQMLNVRRPLTLATTQASTSGTAITFGSIPAGVKRITIMLVGVSSNGTNNFLIQLGDAGGIEVSGYLGSCATLVNAGATVVSNPTTSFLILSASAANILHGTIILNLVRGSTNLWACSGNIGIEGAATFGTTAGSKSLSAELTQLSISAGGDTFDAGLINISYE